LQARPTIAVLGGTGDLGSALARRWAAAGYPIVLGSRSKEKAEAAAREMNANDGSAISGEDNRTAAAKADIVVIAVPYASHDAILNEIKPAVMGKIVVDAVVPLVPPKVSVVKLPPDGSAALSAQRLLAGAARVQSAFHNVSASKLKSSGPVDCDVLVFGDDREAREIVIELANAAGTRGVDGGPLANSAAAEALTSVLIGINRRYKVDSAGLADLPQHRPCQIESKQRLLDAPALAVPLHPPIPLGDIAQGVGMSPGELQGDDILRPMRLHGGLLHRVRFLVHHITSRRASLVPMLAFLVFHVLNQPPDRVGIVAVLVPAGLDQTNKCFSSRHARLMLEQTVGKLAVHPVPALATGGLVTVEQVVAQPPVLNFVLVEYLLWRQRRRLAAVIVV